MHILYISNVYVYADVKLYRISNWISNSTLIILLLAPIPNFLPDPHNARNSRNHAGIMFHGNPHIPMAHITHRTKTSMK